MAVYDREASARSFNDDLILHLLHGFVFSTPDFFMMGRAVVSTADHRDIVNPAFEFERSACDTWHIYLAAGDTTTAWSIMPWPLPLFSFERRNELRFYKVDRIRNHCAGADGPLGA